MDLFNKVKRSKNKIIEEAWMDFLEFNEKSNRTETALIEQIKHSLYVVTCDFDLWGADCGYSQKDINGVKRFLKSL